MITLEEGPDGVFRDVGNGSAEPKKGWKSFLGGRFNNDKQDGKKPEKEDDGSVWNTISFYNKKVIIKYLKLMLWVVAYVGVLAYINIEVEPAVNFYALIVTSALYAAIVLSPTSIVAAGLLGMIHAWLDSSKATPKDLTQGSLKGFNTLIDSVLVGGLFYIHVVTLFLATWQLPGKKEVVAILALSIVLLAVKQKLALKGKWFEWIVFAYTLGAMGMTLWGTLPEETKEDYIPFYTSDGIPRVTGHMEISSGESTIRQMKGAVSVNIPTCNKLNIKPGIPVTWNKALTKAFIHAPDEWTEVTITAAYNSKAPGCS